MWYLISLDDPDVKYALLIGKSYLVGRKNCDIVLSGDAAVSRKHAQIDLEHPESNITNPEKLPTIILTDLSKFGTSVNGDKIQEPTELKDGDLVLFGGSSCFTLVYEPFIISSSCLDIPSKKKVRKAISELGGHMVNEWKKECTLLIMNNISVTIKVVCALVSLKNIVTPEYLEKYVGHLKGENEEPNPKHYLPVITETQVDNNEVTFNIVPERKNIFQGMKFIFLNEKQFKKMHMAVELGGGLPVLLEEKQKKNRMLVEKGSVVMYCEPNQCTQILSEDSNNWILHVQSYLKKHHKHMIQDAELGFAVLYCSTEKHCNPDIDVESQIMRPVPSQSVSNTDVLVANTEVSPNRSPTKIRKKKCETVLDETKFEIKEHREIKQEKSQNVSERHKSGTNRESHSSSKISNKRGHIEDDEEVLEVTPLKKKVKQEVITPAKTQNESRNLRLSPRRSPSPATRSSPRKPKNISPAEEELQKVSSSGTERTSARQSKIKKEIVEDSDEEIEIRRREKHVIVEDSDDEFPDFKSMKRSDDTKRIKKSSESVSNYKRNGQKKPEKNHTKVSDEELDIDQPSQRKPFKEEASPTPRSNSKHVCDIDSDTQYNDGTEQTSKPSKRKILVEDSEDEYMERKGKKKKLTENSDDEFDKLMGKRKTLGQKEIENSDDEFDRIMNKRTKVMDDNDSSDANVNSKNRTRKIPQLSAPEDNDVNRGIKTEVMDNDGFVSTNKADQEENSKTSEYVKEEDLPSKCINIKFVELVARKPNKQTISSTDEVPAGYMKWKGKIVRNFKKFKKTEHSGANTLPRIIGGSDLVAHTAANRKDLDDWFKEAIQAESQQNESERKAQELFDWEPNKKRSR